MGIRAFVAPQPMQLSALARCMSIHECADNDRGYLYGMNVHFRVVSWKTPRSDLSLRPKQVRPSQCQPMRHAPMLSAHALCAHAAPAGYIRNQRRSVLDPLAEALALAAASGDDEALPGRCTVASGVRGGV